MRVKDNGQRNIWPARSGEAKRQLAQMFGQTFEVRQKHSHKLKGKLTVLKGEAVPPRGHYLVTL